eukprot:14970485-Alexandrium_andersonii.AAC.1
MQPGPRDLASGGEDDSRCRGRRWAPARVAACHGKGAMLAPVSANYPSHYSPRGCAETRPQP